VIAPGEIAKHVFVAAALTAAAMGLQESFPVAPGGDTLKWGLQVGGPLFVLILVILFYYRNDFRRSLTESREQNAATREQNKELRQVVVDNTEALTSFRSEVERLARAIENSGRPVFQQQNHRR
jgi:membrane protein implicated in regulation of membrane protease activity